MMLWTIKLLVLTIFIIKTKSFNLENRLPIYKFDTRTNSYFGYSVAIHNETGDEGVGKKWILVGAPLGQNPQPNTTQTGTLKRCPITQKQTDCEDVLTDGRYNQHGRYEKPDDDNEILPPQLSEIKEGQWLGVTVSSQRPSGVILVCAHRYISKSGNTSEHAQHGIGLCYVLGNDFSYNEVFEPCKGRKTEKLHEEYGFCQAGTSGTLLDDGTVVLGAPGVYTWRGSLYLKNVAGSYLKRDKNIYYSPHEGNNPPMDKYSYLGMSVTGGKYFGDSYSYVGGAPRSENHGQVMFFEKTKQNPMRLHEKLDGEQFASGFGYQLVTADVNGDNYPDLLVSAPFYFGRHEGGAVYVFLNDDRKINKKYDLKLTGKLESRFGLAVANIGDINKDDSEDIAIGAPYEDDGVVYIYLGSKDGLSKTPSQVIKASDLGLKPNRKINTFGSYLSGGLDIDGNDYPDLVIGAYNSSAVVALLSRPIISIQTNVPKKGEIKAIDPSVKGCPEDPHANLTCFSFKTCCSIDPLTDKSQTLNIIYMIEAETFKGQKKFSRVYFGSKEANRSNTLHRNFQIVTNGEQTCFNEVVYIKESAKDIQTPIKFHLNYTMVEKPLRSSGLEELNPILDQTQADRVIEASFQKDCGSDDICESQLQVEATLGLEKEKNGQYKFVLGKFDDIQLNVNVKNHADSAYESQLFIVHQSSVTYIAAKVTKGAVICNHYNSTVVACTLGNPLKRGAEAATILRFDPSGLEDSEPRVSFIVFANSTSKEIQPQSPVVLTTNVIIQADLSITGSALPEQVFYGGDIKGESAMKNFNDIGTSVVHTFLITNDGPWKAPHVEVDIDWPHQVENDKTLGKWLLYLEEVPIVDSTTGGSCTISKDLVNPLKLKAFDEPSSLTAPATLQDPNFLRRSNKSHTFTRDKSSFSSAEKKSPSEENVLNRVRRDRSMIIRADKLIDADGKKTNTVTMGCKQKTAKCIRINCKLFNLQRKTEAYITIKSRLWNSTLTLDYPRVDLVKILSTAKLTVPKMYGIKQNTSDDEFTISTHAYPELRDQQPSGAIPIWIIIVGIIVGLFLLALVAFILWKCGFFKRRRPDPTLSGNLEKNSESRPFINK